MEIPLFLSFFPFSCILVPHVWLAATWNAGLWHQQLISSVIFLRWVWIKVLFAAAVVVSPGCLLSPFHFWRLHRFLVFFFLFSFSRLKWMPASFSNLLSAFSTIQSSSQRQAALFSFFLFVSTVFDLWVTMEDKKGDFVLAQRLLERCPATFSVCQKTIYLFHCKIKLQGSPSPAKNANYWNILELFILLNFLKFMLKQISKSWESKRNKMFSFCPFSHVLFV